MKGDEFGLPCWDSWIKNKKIIFICLDHFDPNDFQTRTNGKRFIKQDANTLTLHSLFENSSIR